MRAMGARFCRSVASALVLCAVTAALAASAKASVSPSLSLDQSAGTTAVGSRTSAWISSLRLPAATLLSD